MELRQLEYFLEVCRTKNITRAAEALFVSQPSVTTSIKRLEAELGVELLMRTNKRITVTQEGELFLRQAAKILDLVEDTAHMMADYRQEPQGILNLGITPMMSVLFPAILAEYQRTYPQVTLKVVEEGSVSLASHLGRGELDLGILITGNLAEELSCMPILQGQILACLPPDHHLAGCDAISLADLKEESFILFQEDTYTRQLIMNSCTALQFSPKVVFSSSQIGTVSGLVKAGMGISFFFESIARSLDSVVTKPLTEPLTLEAGLAWNRERYQSKAAEKLIELFSSAFPA